jgi:enamine deaminase RidA (YjgF/YER057c/UK114 family)
LLRARRERPRRRRAAQCEYEFSPSDVEAQCENCFRNVARALEQAGAGLDDLVRVLIFVTSPEEFERIMPIRKHCYAARPANTTVFAQLVAAHMRVEIETTARLR